MNLRSIALILALLPVSSSAHAQWTRIEDVPITNIYSVWAKGDTITATADSVVYVSTNGGTSFKISAPVAPGVTSVQAARMRNGRLYAGTFGQGVFISDNLGDSWVAFNQGLTGGFLNTQLFIADLLVDGGKLCAATSGDGPWMRNLATNANWTHFSNIFEPNQASNMNAIAAGGTRLLASAGFNGTVFFRDAGDSEWTISWLDNIGIAPGLAALTAIWTGSQWVVGANTGIFYSAQGQSPWTFVDLGFGTVLSSALATRGSDLFGAFGDGSTAVIEYSLDHGVTWHVLDALPATFVFGLATRGDTLYAARFDGLWARSISTVAVQPVTWGTVKSLYRTPGK
ncbi:MAG TPA: hypothetical protein VFH33_05460 [Candidatus Krumholzibacteria bacterium]|nr:hypothetical protein [Candidatus Krumholzibacteria bacterium]